MVSIKVSPDEVIIALNRKLHEANLEATFKFDGEDYDAVITTNFTDYDLAGKWVKAKLADLIAVVPMDIWPSTRGSATAHVTLRINNQQLQNLLAKPLPMAA
jgi:hypothetical protein